MTECSTAKAVNKINTKETSENSNHWSRQCRRHARSRLGAAGARNHIRSTRRQRRKNQESAGINRNELKCDQYRRSCRYCRHNRLECPLASRGRGEGMWKPHWKNPGGLHESVETRSDRSCLGTQHICRRADRRPGQRCTRRQSLQHDLRGQYGQSEVGHARRYDVNPCRKDPRASAKSAKAEATRAVRKVGWRLRTTAACSGQPETAEATVLGRYAELTATEAAIPFCTAFQAATGRLRGVGRWLPAMQPSTGRLTTGGATGWEKYSN